MGLAAIAPNCGGIDDHFSSLLLWAELYLMELEQLI